MMDIRPEHPLRRLFSGLVEETFFTRVGMCDPLLTDYLSDLLVTFTHVDQLQAMRNVAGKRLDRIAAMLSVMTEGEFRGEAERERQIYRSIGDFTLFWAGVYPEQLQRAAPESADTLLTYVSQGKRSYALASQLSGDEDRPPARLFRHLSDDFEHCLFGLGLVRKGLESCADLADSRGDLIL